MIIFIHDFKKKKTQQSRNRRELSQLDKNIYKKSTASIIHNGERLNAFFPKTGNKIKMPYVTALNQHNLKNQSWMGKNH